MAAEAEAPDLLAPLLAWRSWNLRETEDGWRLASIHYRETWAAGRRVEAWCYRSTTFASARAISHDRHDAPAPGCQCGIYGGDGLDQLREYLVPDHVGWESISGESRYVHRVMGLVSLWGRAVECTNGYRAAYGYPERLWVPMRTPDERAFDVEAVALDLVDYGVPVELLDAGSRDAIVDNLREREAGLTAR